MDKQEYLRISFYDEKDEQIRILPTINLFNSEEVKNLRETIYCKVDEGRLNPEDRDKTLEIISNFF
tara:strand:+ start:153 stop:350 length:198 start_codon:yes stop_codon:yes gene_type:complete